MGRTNFGALMAIKHEDNVLMGIHIVEQTKQLIEQQV